MIDVQDPKVKTFRDILFLRHGLSVPPASCASLIDQGKTVDEVAAEILAAKSNGKMLRHADVGGA